MRKNNKNTSTHPDIHWKEYFMICGIPAGLFLLIKLLYTLSFGTCFTVFLPWHTLPFLMLAGGCLYFFLKHSPVIGLQHFWQILLFTTAYSFCAYGLLQETSISSLLLYAIFPVIFYTFENMLVNSRFLPFILSCTFMLYLQPETGIQITLLLFVLAMLTLALKRQLNVGNFLHFTGTFIFAFGLGAARIAFYIAPYIAEHKDYNYNGFSTSYLPAIFAGRFLPGVTASRLLSGTSNRMDLYFGLLPLLCFFVFFVMKKISFRKKVFAGIYTIVLLTMLEFSPVYYIFNLFHITYHSTLKASFILIFWMLYLGMQAVENIEQTTTADFIHAIAVFLCCWSISLLWGKHNFILPILILMPVLVIIYSFLLTRACKNPKICLLLLILCISELGINEYISINRDLYNTNSSLETSFVLSTTKTPSADSSRHEKSTENSDDTLTKKQYDTFVSKNTPSDTSDILQYMLSNIKLSDKEKKKYCNTLFPDDFQIFNAKCQKLGISGTLFTPCKYTIQFSPSQIYDITEEGNHIYNIYALDSSTLTECYVDFTISLKAKTTNNIYQTDNISGNFLKLNQRICSGKAKDYVPIVTNKGGSTNFQILLYQMDNTVYKKLEKTINQISDNNSAKSSSYLLYDYAGIGITFLFVMLFSMLFLYDKREELYQSLYKLKTQSSHISFLHTLDIFLKTNYVYILSFFIPFLLFVITMVVGDALPFGANSIFDADGTVSTIPAFLDQYYKYQNGNQYLSMNIGFGTDLTFSYSIYLLSKLYHFLPLTMVIPSMEFMLAFCLGLCGLNMTIYMTHRSKHTAINCRDFRLLLPACIYALNAYILASRNYPTWYLVLMLFPLVMLAMDNLMEKKKILAYSALLGICILAEIQLAMFICIFLVIHFFTYRFQDFKDFVCRGIRFGFASLLGGGCGFIVVYRTLTTYQGSGYSTTDHVFPALGFHGSFWAQWRKLMIFTPTDATSLDPGNISLYCGIFTLLLASVYFLYKKTTLADKLRYLIPIVILSVSYNGQVLSYLWNGLHYQSNCPNRYVFLLIFLLAEIAYDGFTLLPKLSLRKLQPVILGWTVFFILCGIFRSEVMDHSLLWTLAAFMIYVFLHCQVRLHSLSIRRFYYIFVAVALLELSSNTIYTANTWNYTALQQYNDYESAQNIYQEMRSDGTYSRSLYPAMRVFNQGQYYNTGCINSFGTCLDLNQLTLAQQYGFNATTNTMYSEYSSSPLYTAISNCRYIMLPIVTEHAIYDLTNYKYLGIWQNTYYVFENPNYCALGFYYPSEAVEQTLDSLELSSYLNQLSKLYCTSETSVYHYGVIDYNTDRSAENAFYFTDAAGRQISPEKGYSILNGLTNSDLRSGQVKMHINYTASKDAYYYLSAYGMTSLGKLYSGQNSLTINLPNELILNDNKYNILLYNKEDAQKMLDVIHQNQLTDIRISNDTITGTSNYKKSGYTIYSLGYSKNWHAYIDGKEVETLNPYDTNLLVPTPAGKHTVTLKFIPYRFKTCQFITLGFWILCGMIFLFKQIRLISFPSCKIASFL